MSALLAHRVRGLFGTFAALVLFALSIGQANAQSTDPQAIDCGSSLFECSPLIIGPPDYQWIGTDQTAWRSKYSSLESAVAGARAIVGPYETFNFHDVWAPLDPVETEQWQYYPDGVTAFSMGCFGRPTEPSDQTSPQDIWCVRHAQGKRIGGLSMHSSISGTDSLGNPYESIWLRLAVDRPVSCQPGFGLFLELYVSNLIVCYRNGTTSAPVKLERNVGDCCVTAGNPVNVATGSKVEQASDGSVGGDLPISLDRIYDSKYADFFGADNWSSTGIGNRWRWKFASSLHITRLDTGSVGIVATRPDGKEARFGGGSTVGLPAYKGIDDAVQEEKDGSGNTIGWFYRRGGSRVFEHYNANGRLDSVQDGNGHVHLYAYDAADRIISITDEQGRYVNFKYLAVAGGVQTVESNPPTGPSFQPGQVRQITDSAGRTWTYDYDLTTKTLVSVTYPDGAKTLYHYEDARDALLLTGKSNVSISGVQTREATYAYDTSGRAISTSHAGGAQSYTIEYLAGNQTKVTRVIDAATNQSQTSTYTFEPQFGRLLPTANSGACFGCRKNASTTYDTLGYPNLVTDFKGTVTDFDYNSRGLIVQRVESSNVTASRRTTQTDWAANFDLPTAERVYDSATGLPGVLKGLATWAYNTRGQATARCQIDPSVTKAKSYVCGSAANAPTGVRQTRITYCEQADVTVGRCPRVGLPTSNDGPRIDVSDASTYAYYSADDADCVTGPATCAYRKGDLWKVTNALGQVTQFNRYDGAGNVLSTTTPDGVVTDVEYNSRGWMTATKSRGTDNASETDDAIVRLDYDSSGQMVLATQPDGTALRFTYDDDHRLTDVSDGLNNTVHYNLDSAGNTTREDTRDSSGTVMRTASRVYNALGQLSQSLNAASQSTLYTFDAAGNPDLTSDPLNHTSDQNVDALNRLVKIVRDVAGIAATTQYQYDVRDNLTKVTDPKSLSTVYTYNGLGDLIQTSSPDSGSTTYGYDSAGNRVSQTDANSVVTNYTYDALNRPLQVSYPKFSTLTATYAYDSFDAICGDAESFGKGHLSMITDISGITQYCYDRLGNTTRKQVTNNGVVSTMLFAYTSAGRLSSVTYPSGMAVNYSRSVTGQITQVDVKQNGVTTTLVNNVTYKPFGPISRLEFPNPPGGTATGPLRQTRVYDLDYAVTSVGGLTYGVDAVGNITAIGDATGNDTYVYDGMDRLKTVVDADTGQNVYAFTYDTLGNRLSKKVGAAAIQTYVYPSTSHRLSSVAGVARTYNSAGNTTQAAANKIFTYDGRNRIVDFRTGSASSTIVSQYQYNGKGERVRKYKGTTDQASYTYDEAGRLLVEKRNTNNQEIIWLDNVPVGISQNGTLYGILSDNLYTPRQVFELGSQRRVWAWNSLDDAFGENSVVQDPDGDGVPFVFDMRFPGQVYDSESGLNYNYFRDYDPSTGRYIESDPIGLGGGISTYGYVGGNPLRWIDSRGLAYFAKRPLNHNEFAWMGGGSCSVGGIDDRLNSEVSHEQIFFEDGKSPSNVGFGANGLFSDPSNAGYRCKSAKYNDCLMRKAVANTPPSRPYCLLGKPGSKEKYNCQDWADQVRAEYLRLASNPSEVESCKTCEGNGK